MEISKSGINTSTIDKPNFLKIPAEPYLEMLGIEPIPSQIALLNVVNDNRFRFICAAYSRRQGKTYISNIIGQLVALVPGSNVLIMSPNYSLSQISFDLQRSLIKHFEIEVNKDNAKDKVIELCNDSQIRMGSISQVDSCVGRSYDFILFDECALNNAGKEAFNVALRPTLDKPNSKAIFISTFRRQNWFWDFHQRGYSDRFPSWVSLLATYHDNPRMNEDDVEEARNSMSKAEFEQEYLCSADAMKGAIFNLDSENILEFDKESFDYSKIDVIGGIDVGFRDATFLVIIGYDWVSDCYYVLDEYKQSGVTTESHALAIKEKLDKWDVDFCYIDSAAQQTRYDWVMMYDISTINAKKDVLEGIGMVANIIEKNRLKIHTSCVDTISSIRGYMWDIRSTAGKEKPVHDDNSHGCDALRYALYSFEMSGAGVY